MGAVPSTVLQSSDLRMIFLLRLVAVVSASEDIEQQTNSPHIFDLVESKTVEFLPELEIDADAETEAATETLTVFQEIHKLDDIVMDDTPIVVNENELSSTVEDLELNEISNNLGDDDIQDVIHNFIADKDPILQLFLSICFIHPSCYQESPPSGLLSDGDIDLEAASPLARDVARNLLERRTEKARTILISALMETQDKVKFLMFKYMETGVGARGVSVLATWKIIDSLKNIWVSVNSDLEYAKSSLQELFYLLPLNTSEEVKAVMEVAVVIQNIPGKVEALYREAAEDGTQDSLLSSSSWPSQNSEEDRK